MEYTIFNPEYLINVTGGDPATMEEIAGIFMSQIPEFVAEMNELLENEKYYELGLLAHKAKGSVSVMGMEDTSKMLKEFELLAKAGEQKERYGEFIQKFRDDASTVTAEINDYLSRSK
ncbi:MAG: Hpt domain-containing protein [Bacteroidales bacterium]|nr:Hpt domain-containing protein [Bacteroidales bacterium]